MTTNDKTLRMKYLINPKFQLKVTFYSITTSLCLLAIVYFSHVYHYNNLIQMGQKLGLPKGHTYFSLISSQRKMMLELIGWLTLGFVTILSISGIYLSHKIAGPLHRLTCYFRNSEQLESKDLSFRKNDFFQEIPETINDFFKNNH